MKKLLIYFIFASIYIGNANAQVTIGSPLPPSKGALLDLKENENLGPNSTKGLLLPKVVLSNFKELYPMYDSTAQYYITNKAQIKKDHIGMIVYNLRKQQTDPCDFTASNASEGLFIWNGQKWVDPLAKNKTNTDDDVLQLSIRNPSVRIFYDTRGGKKEPYPCRKFGDDIWMTTNLRATTYDSPTPGPPPLLQFDSPADWDTNISSKRKSYYYCPYPLYDDDGHINFGYKDYFLKRNPLIGYLYNYRAAVGGKISTSGHRQGICPKGWRLPEKGDYDNLLKAIKANMSEYLIEDENGNYPDKESLTFRDALLVQCSPFKESTLQIKGRSKSYSDGGFGMFVIGTLPMEKSINAFARTAHPIFLYDGGGREDVFPSTTTPADVLSMRNKVILITSSGEFYKPASNYPDMAIVYGMRCIKNNKQFDF